MLRLAITRNPNLGGGTGSGYRYVLGMTPMAGEDEQTLDVTSGLVDLHLHMNEREANKVQLTFRLDDVDISAEALASLQALVEAKDEEVPSE